MQTYPKGMQVVQSKTVAVTTSPQIVDLDHHTAYLMNSGTGKIFIAAPNATPTATDWPLAAGEKSAFPFDGKFSVVSDSTATLNLLYVDVDFIM